MSLDQIAPAALSLPLRERAMLATSLWEILDDPFAAADIDESEALALAIERDRQIESGEVVPLSHDELMRRLRQ